VRGVRGVRAGTGMTAREALRSADVAAGALRIPRDVAEEAVAHARSELPNEACGLLAGDLRRGTVTRLHRARNIERSPLRFNVHPDDLVRAVYAMERDGEDLVAIFHSHTRSPAVPSAMDRREAQYPGAFYLIASLTDASAPAARALRAWRIHGGQAFEVPVRIG
jgi:[CysO sulfur-carrier protein]-S-L-cysteine hydrolase